MCGRAPFSAATGGTSFAHTMRGALWQAGLVAPIAHLVADASVSWSVITPRTTSAKAGASEAREAASAPPFLLLGSLHSKPSSPPRLPPIFPHQRWLLR